MNKKTHRRINVVMSIHLLKRIDKAAKNRKMSRSAFLAESAKRELERPEEEFTGRLRWMKPKAGGEYMKVDPPVLQQEVAITRIDDDGTVIYSIHWVDVPMVGEGAND